MYVYYVTSTPRDNPFKTKILGICDSRELIIELIDEDLKRFVFKSVSRKDCEYIRSDMWTSVLGVDIFDRHYEAVRYRVKSDEDPGK